MARKSEGTLARETNKSQNRFVGSLTVGKNIIPTAVGRESIPFTVKGPIPVHLPEAGGEKGCQTRCSILDLTFQYPAQIGELVFTNFYTAWLSVYVKRNVKPKKLALADVDAASANRKKPRPVLERSFSIDIHSEHFRTPNGSMDAEGDSPTSESKTHLGESSRTENTGHVGDRAVGPPCPRRHSSGSLNVEKLNPGDGKPWELSVEMKNLMPWPHYENGSQDLISILATESLTEWRDVLVLRLILHQPSSVWKKFTVEEIDVFRHLPKRGYTHCADLLKQRDNWLSMLRVNTKTMLSGQLVEPETTDDSTPA